MRERRAHLIHNEQAVELAEKNDADLWTMLLAQSKRSVMIKLLRDKEGAVKDVLFAHNAWTDYAEIVRIYKIYDFAVGDGNGRRTSAFSSYAGMISSTDDWYLLSSGLVVMETTLNVIDRSAYAHVDKNKFNPVSWMRVMVAKDGDEHQRMGRCIQHIQLPDVLLHMDDFGYEKNPRRCEYKESSLPPYSFLVLETLPGFTRKRICRRTSPRIRSLLATIFHIFAKLGCMAIIRPKAKREQTAVPRMATAAQTATATIAILIALGVVRRESMRQALVVSTN